MCGGRWAGQAESSCSRKSGTECVLPQPGECFISTLIPQILICRCMFGLNYSARETRRLPDYLPVMWNLSSPSQLDWPLTMSTATFMASCSPKSFPATR